MTEPFMALIVLASTIWPLSSAVPGWPPSGTYNDTIYGTSMTPPSAWTQKQNENFADAMEAVHNADPSLHDEILEKIGDGTIGIGQLDDGNNGLTDSNTIGLDLDRKPTDIAGTIMHEWTHVLQNVTGSQESKACKQAEAYTVQMNYYCSVGCESGGTEHPTCQAWSSTRNSQAKYAAQCSAQGSTVTEPDCGGSSPACGCTG